MNDSDHIDYKNIRLLNLIDNYNLFSILIDARFYRTSTNILGLEKAESFIVSRRFNKKYTLYYRWSFKRF